jgi:hypothetical protein
VIAQHGQKGKRLIWQRRLGLLKSFNLMPGTLDAGNT